jgi:hypothetical protein
MFVGLHVCWKKEGRDRRQKVEEDISWKTEGLYLEMGKLYFDKCEFEVFGLAF